jgi:hypothetical protein
LTVFFGRNTATQLIQDDRAEFLSQPPKKIIVVYVMIRGAVEENGYQEVARCPFRSPARQGGRQQMLGVTFCINFDSLALGRE